MNKPKIVAIAGSARVKSLNRMLLAVAANACRDAGAEVEVIELADLALPLYDGDREAAEGAPSAVARLKTALYAADGLLIASPEHNSSLSAALKNAIDWASRPAPDEPPLACFKGKVAALLAASPGVLGGLGGLHALRSILGNIGVIVLPDQVAVVKAHEILSADGLSDPRVLDKIKALAMELVRVSARVSPN